MTPPLLAVRDVHKRFPGVHALRGVSIDFHAGEVHAVVGENGAGKSTLMHLLAGVHRPDAPGGVLLDGAPVTIEDELHAQRLGIAIVYQERSLFDLLSVAENVFAARQPVRRGRIDRAALHAATARILAELEVEVDPRTPLGALSPALQQMVEIAKALSLEPRVLILDEPTAALTETETEALFRVIGRLRARGLAILYISHRLQEIFRIAQRVTVLRDGTHQGTLPIRDTDPEDLVRRMVGRDVTLARHAPGAAGAPRLEVRGLADRPGPGALLADIAFEARAGEVLAFAGLAGAGRTELALSLLGARPRGAGEIRIDGVAVDVRAPHQAIAAGLGYLSEDRKELGLFLDMTLAENVAAAALGQFGRWWLDDRRRDEVAAEYRRRLGIAGGAIDRPVRALSGGNQQKVALAKWLLVSPRVLIVDEPTRGVDVGAKAEVQVRHLQRQTHRRVGLVPLPIVRGGADQVERALRGLEAAGVEIALGDATEDQDLTALADGSADLPLLGGGSALAAALARLWVTRGVAPAAPGWQGQVEPGPLLLLAGSCADRTLEQIGRFRAAGLPAIAVDVPAAVRAPDEAAARLDAQAAALGEAPTVLVHSSMPPTDREVILQQAARAGVSAEAARAALERTLAQLAVRFVARGGRKVVVAGGETSGAVMDALVVGALEIGPLVAPGVPVCRTVGGRPLTLVLKSGNFGGPDSFQRCLELLADRSRP